MKKSDKNNWMVGKHVKFTHEYRQKLLALKVDTDAFLGFSQIGRVKNVISGGFVLVEYKENEHSVYSIDVLEFVS